MLSETGPDAVTAAMSRTLFDSSPVVIVASGGASATTLDEAARQAVALHVPLLLAPPPVPVEPEPPPSSPGTSAGTSGAVSAAPSSLPVLPDGRPLATELRRLQPAAVLAVGPNVPQLPAGIRVDTDPAALPRLSSPAPLTDVAVLAPAEPGPADDPITAAALASSRAVGATIITVRGSDPRTDPTAILALSKARPSAVVAIGAAFGSPDRLASRVAVAATGVQLPGGGQVLFPGRRLIALYGHPGSGVLGALGQQSLSASIDRAKRVAASYAHMSDAPVVPTMEIIATVASAGPGRDGSYSSMSSADSLRPWVEAAGAAGMYVVLDLQPGRTNFLDQAKQYESLLELPYVGLALDPEWRLRPNELPLRQIGSVSAAEVNRVVDWLAEITARRHLPQKLLVLHQFLLGMLEDEHDIDLSRDELAILIHMDGQGGPGAKEATWGSVVRAAPKGAWLGWKNFYVMDHPTWTPAQTMAMKPAPVMISYQ